MRANYFSRRAFMATAAWTAASHSWVWGQNNRIRLAVIGPGARGQHVMSLFQKSEQVEIVALADIFDETLDKAKQLAPRAKVFHDYRKLLEEKDIDAVLVAVPDHWHTPVAIDVLNSGRDLYIEKPLTLAVEQGPQIVKAARLNGRIAQVGMQQRSGRHYLRAKREYFDTKKLGKVTLVRTWWHGNTYHLRKAPPAWATKPSTLDWAAFLGPVKWREWDPQQYYNWRAYLDFGGGQITDLFTHWVDVVHMFMGDDIPVSAVAAGGVYYYKDGRTAPDTINVLLEYPSEFTVTFEATLAPGITGAGIEFCGTEGRLEIDRQRYIYQAAGKGTPLVTVKAEDVMGEPDGLTLDHVNNFLESMRTRKTPNGDVLIGHRSAQASHLGNIAYLEKRRIKFDPIREQILPL